MENRKEVKSVVGQICNMLENNYLCNDTLPEQFEGWCQEQFDTEEEKALMKEIAPYVNKLTMAVDEYLHRKYWEEKMTQWNNQSQFGCPFTPKDEEQED